MRGPLSAVCGRRPIPVRHIAYGDSGSSYISKYLKQAPSFGDPGSSDILNLHRPPPLAIPCHQARRPRRARPAASRGFELGAFSRLYAAAAARCPATPATTPWHLYTLRCRAQCRFTLVRESRRFRLGCRAGDLSRTTKSGNFQGQVGRTGRSGKQARRESEKDPKKQRSFCGIQLLCT